jgi:hypothetical protein
VRERLARGHHLAAFGVARAAPGQRDAELGRGAFHELAHRVLLAGRDHVVARLGLLQHQPLHLDVVPRVAPVAQRAQVAEADAALEPRHHARQAAA